MPTRYVHDPLPFVHRRIEDFIHFDSCVWDGNRQAEALSEAVHTFFDLLSTDDRNGPQLLPALDVVPLQNLSPHAELLEQRAIGLWRLANRRVPLFWAAISRAG